jgi:cell division septation protein DedD
VPLLGDIPFLGHLFKKTTKSKTLHELVVLITPHIMGTEPDDVMRETIDDVEEMAVPSESTLYREREGSPHTVRTPPFRPRGALARAAEPSRMTDEPVADEPAETPLSTVEDHSEELAVAVTLEPAETPSSALATPGYEVDEAAASCLADVTQSLLGVREEEAPGAAVEASESPVIEQDGYSVQVFAARNEKITGDYVASLQQDGILAWVRPPDLTVGDEWYRAMIGRFSTRADAKEKLKSLQQGEVFVDAFVRDHASENAPEEDERVICTRERTRSWSRSSRQTHDGRKEAL